MPDVGEECRSYVCWHGRVPTPTSTSTAAHARTAQTGVGSAHHGGLRSGAGVGGGLCGARIDERADAESDSGTSGISASQHYGTSHRWGWAIVQRRVMRYLPVRQPPCEASACFPAKPPAGGRFHRPVPAIHTQSDPRAGTQNDKATPGAHSGDLRGRGEEPVSWGHAGMLHAK